APDVWIRKCVSVSRSFEHHSVGLRRLLQRPCSAGISGPCGRDSSEASSKQVSAGKSGGFPLLRVSSRGYGLGGTIQHVPSEISCFPNRVRNDAGAGSRCSELQDRNRISEGKGCARRSSTDSSRRYHDVLFGTDART